MNKHYDLDMERALLSTCLKSPAAFEDIREIVKITDFYDQKHKEIFEAMILCTQNKDPVDESFVRKYKNIDEQTLALIISVTTLVDAQKHASELREMGIKRGLIDLGASMGSRVRSDLKADVIVDSITKDIFEISKDATTALIKDAPSIVMDLELEWEQQKLRENKGILGLDTGFGRLNDMSKGFKEGELIILAARPGMGKTTLCLNFLYKALKEDKGVALFSLEMPATQILQRLIAEHTSIPLQRLMTGQLSDDEWSRTADACEYFSNKKLFVHDSGYATILDVRAILRKLKSKEDSISICALDYIQLMTSSSSFTDRHLQVSEISRGLKLLARELKLPIIALSQLNRSLESRPNKRPILSDLRESGAIEQDADTILFVYRGDVYKEALEKEKEAKARSEGKEYIPNFTANPNEEDAELIVGKNRHGPTGTIDMVFQKQHSTFKEKDLSSDPDTFTFQDFE